MWFIIHFYMMYFLQLSFSFHLWSMIFFLIYILLHMSWEDVNKKVLLSTFGLFLMYLGIFLFNSVVEFSYLPYYVVSLSGLRNRMTYIIIASIIVGLHLYKLKTIQIIGHVCMNIGRIIKKNTMN